jgi:hypothetical protein
MARWLLNTFPTWLLAIVVVGGFALLALAGLRLVRRVAPDIAETSDFAGVMAGVIAAVYGVFLAFAIVALYEEFHEAELGVQTESAALTRLVTDSAGLGPATEQPLRAAVKAYRDAVTGPEWAAMEDGDASQRAWEGIAGIHAVLDRVPAPERDSPFFDAALTAVDDVVDARRERLHAAESTLPSAIMVLLIGGGVLTLAFTLVFGAPVPRMHTAMVLSFAVLIGFSLLVALLLDHPFSGDVAVSSAPLHEDALHDL